MASPCRRDGCCREIKGPTPCSVAVVEKYSGTRSQSKMVKETEQDIKCDTYKQFVEDFEVCRRRNILAVEDERKELLCRIKNNLKKAMVFYVEHIEERRERLRELLEAEEKEYMNQLNLLGETRLEKQAKMRQQVKDLKIRRECDRQRLIAEKLDQQFREECEELRIKLSHQQVQALPKDWQAQREFKKRLHNQQKEEDYVFDELWEKDRIAKEERAEKEMREQHEKRQAILAGQLEQIAEADAKRMDQKQWKKQEGELMKETQRLLKLEDEWLAREKIQKQKELRDTLDTSMALKAKRVAKEQEEEHALDLKLRDEALREVADDVQAQMQKKMDLKREQQLYRNYLTQRADNEKLQEEETNRLIEAEMEKTIAKRNEQNRLKKEAQDSLLKEVMETRKLQVQEKLEKNTKSPQQLADERATLDAFVEDQKQVEDEKLAREKQIKKEFQQDLLGQINYQKQQREREKMEKQREDEAGILQEEAYLKKLQEALSKPEDDAEKIHPWRRKHCPVPKDVC
ncbi:cilia- and flagella-associated protein 53 [Leucoraja erinacea]|uniref:cilia- and flagella-associated protein 53 n=1 Tax=Leucoraja erinaceus TaxID=7782 RepID=UPI0024568C0A|nr:cilia- and flagella-associated protein 53 [Leucoraja erinacea]